MFDLGEYIWPKFNDDNKPQRPARITTKYAGRASALYILNQNLYNYNLATGQKVGITTVGSGNTLNNDYIATNGAGYFDLQVGSVDTTNFTVIIGTKAVSGNAAFSFLARSANWNGVYGAGSNVSSVKSNVFDGSVGPVSGSRPSSLFNVLAFSYSTNNLRGSLNGGSVTTDSTASSWGAGPFTKIAIGAAVRDTADNYTSCRCNFLAVIRGVLTDYELIALSMNPYSLLESESSSFYFISANSLAGLSGQANASTVATGIIESTIPIVGAGIGINTSAGVINQSISLAENSAALSIAQGNVNITVTLSGDGFSHLMASGVLAQFTPLAGASGGATTGSGDLTTGALSSLNGAATLASTGTGQINLTSTLSGSAIASLLATADINPDSGLLGGAHSAVSGSGGLVMSLPLLGSAQAIVTGSTGLSSSIPLSGAAITINKSTGDVTVGVGGLTGAAIIDALAGGNISLSLSVAGDALARAMAAATLSVAGDYVIPSGLYDISTRTPIRQIRSYHAH